MRKIFPIIMIVCLRSFSLNYIELPHTMYDDSIAYAADVNENYWEIRDKVKELIDSLEENFTRYTDFYEDTIRGNPDVDSLRGNPYIDSIETDYIDAGKMLCLRADIDTLGYMAELQTGYILADDSIRGNPDVDSLMGFPYIDSITTLSIYSGGGTFTGNITANLFDGVINASSATISGGNIDGVQIGVYDPGIAHFDSIRTGQSESYLRMFDTTMFADCYSGSDIVSGSVSYKGITNGFTTTLWFDGSYFTVDQDSSVSILISNAGEKLYKPLRESTHMIACKSPVEMTVRARVVTNDNRVYFTRESDSTICVGGGTALFTFSAFAVTIPYY